MMSTHVLQNKTAPHDRSICTAVLSSSSFTGLLTQATNPIVLSVPATL